MPSDQVVIYVLGGAVAVLLLLVVTLAYLAGRRSRPVGEKGALVALPPGAEALAPAFTELRGHLAQVQERVQALDTASAARRGTEDQVWEAIRRIETAVASLGQLPAAQQSLQIQVADALQTLSLINEIQERRHKSEDQAFSALQRLSAVLLGSATAGAAGERVVQEALANLPPQWKVTNHAVGGSRVEFAIRLPDNLLLPIDSKVVAQSKLDTLAQAVEGEHERLANEIVQDVQRRAAEIRQYVDERTPGFAIAAIPDAAYALSGRILADAYQKNRALIVPYSLLGPFILMVYEQHRRASVDFKSAEVAQVLANLETHLATAQSELNGRLSEGITRLTNARAALQGELAAASQKIARLRAAASDGAQE
ncbi:MAG TPA: DNA recombination protein RmuC [Ktedonobacterales bacterium]|nr:DNA recombination protein RmuC [Ktedonobacterales bacterium]